MVEPIEDTNVNHHSDYINDLEDEIDNLTAQLLIKDKTIKSLTAKLEQRETKSCCSAYNKIKETYHKLLDEVLPF